ncbi:DUF3592 domain-containing protein [Terriglobus roseus]|nr:DUF3592 domain-containing protein [Terriglobus roseus]
MNQKGWHTTEAEIVNCSLSWLHSDYGNSNEGIAARSIYTADFLYEVDGKTYRHSMRISNPERVGDKFELAYDPANPDRNDAPDQSINFRDGRSILRHLVLWGCGIAVALLLLHYFPEIR